jgi:hypothetical protein
MPPCRANRPEATHGFQVPTAPAGKMGSAGPRTISIKNRPLAKTPREFI